MPKPIHEVQKFIEVLREAGYEASSYSGRGMYGKSCVSIKGNQDDPVTAWDIAKSIWYYRDDDFIDVPEPRQDQLGLGIVLYWPSYEWPQEEK